ncbi:putative protein serine/threonine kinase [Nowakowskiella sp. JEL0407]|nr:putative protein serine/threonine kinase [Nowakowskiella sp. JEL0407]
MADIWSLGITAIELATGKPPFSDIHPMRAISLIPKFTPPQLPETFSLEFRDFVWRCCKKDPTKRLKAKELLSHPFISREINEREVRDLIRKCKISTPTLMKPIRDRENRPNIKTFNDSGTWDFDNSKA